MLSSVHAAAVPDPAKTFKFQVDDPKKGKWFLAAAGAGTQDAAKALVCQLTADVITCGGKGFPTFGGDMTRLTTTGSSTGWTIDATDNIHWGTNSKMKFSLGSGNDIYAEMCEHHGFAHGTAKAVYTVTAVTAT